MGATEEESQVFLVPAGPTTGGVLNPSCSWMAVTRSGALPPSLGAYALLDFEIVLACHAGIVVDRLSNCEAKHSGIMSTSQ